MSEEKKKTGEDGINKNTFHKCKHLIGFDNKVSYDKKGYLNVLLGTEVIFILNHCAQSFLK